MPDTPKSKNPHVTTKYFASHCDSLNSKDKKKKTHHALMWHQLMCVSKSPLAT